MGILANQDHVSLPSWSVLIRQQDWFSIYRFVFSAGDYLFVRSNTLHVLAKLKCRYVGDLLWNWGATCLVLLLGLGVRAASNSAYYGYPELWILRYPAHRYRAVPSPGFEPTTFWLRVRCPNHSATMLHLFGRSTFDILSWFCTKLSFKMMYMIWQSLEKFTEIWPSEYTPFFQVFSINFFEKTSSKGKLGAYFMKSIRNSNESAVLLNYGVFYNIWTNSYITKKFFFFLFKICSPFSPFSLCDFRLLLPEWVTFDILFLGDFEYCSQKFLPYRLAYAYGTKMYVGLLLRPLNYMVFGPFYGPVRPNSDIPKLPPHFLKSGGGPPEAIFAP
jgi:hypothetical protein